MQTVYTGPGGFGGVRTDTPIAPVPGMDPGLLNLAREIVQRRLQQRPQAAAAAPAAPAYVPRSGSLEGGGSAPMRAQEKPDPMDERPPMVWSFPGGQPVLTMDVDHMTARQRQMFLPQNSTNNPVADAAANAAQQETRDKDIAGINDQWRETGGMGVSGDTKQRRIDQPPDDPYRMMRQRQLNAGYGSY